MLVLTCLKQSNMTAPQLCMHGCDAAVRLLCRSDMQHAVTTPACGRTHLNVTAALCQCLLAVHHACATLVTQLLHLRCADLYCWLGCCCWLLRASKTTTQQQTVLAQSEHISSQCSTLAHALATILHSRSLPDKLAYVETWHSSRTKPACVKPDRCISCVTSPAALAAPSLLAWLLVVLRPSSVSAAPPLLQSHLTSSQGPHQG